MTSPAADSFYFCDLFSTLEMREVFCDEGRIRAWLKVESALAAAQAECGVIPAEAAKRIESVALYENIDIIAMKAEYDRVGFPISPLVHQLEDACDPETSLWIHWGATSQDIIDTGLVLQMREALSFVEVELVAVMKATARLARDHRDTVMVGRTFKQHAVPISFGFKVSVWLSELLRHRERLFSLKQRVLVCQFGGAVGTLATLGQEGLKVRHKLSERLGLEEPTITWHTARDGWSELIHWIAMVAATLSKMAAEIAALMRTEIGEVREPFVSGRGSSSTMPQKRNPIAAPPVIAIANRLRECVGSQLTAMLQDHERATASQPLEWLVVPEAFLLLSGALKHSRETLEGLEVDGQQMRNNLAANGGFLMAEAVMMGLAPHIGRSQAHRLVTAAVVRALDSSCELREELMTDSEVMKHLTNKELDDLFEPANYLGCSGRMIDAVLSKFEDQTDE